MSRQLYFYQVIKLRLLKGKRGKMVKGPKDEEPTIRLINSVVFFNQSGEFAGNAKAETFGFNSLPNYYGPGADGPQIYLLFICKPGK